MTTCDGFQAELPDLLYGELPPERRATAESHAEACAACGGLLGQLRGIRGGVSAVEPPPHLALRLKLAARDVLLDREEGAGSRAAGGELLRAVAALLLAGCVIVAAFALGVAFERGRPDALPVAEGPGLVAIPSPPARVPAGSGEGASSVTRDPATGAAWQRVLLEAARDHLRAGEAAKARSFFLRSAAMAPRSALATAARLGAAEALLAQGRRPEAREELERLRREVRGGVQPGDAAQLQQISELLQQE